MAATVGRYAWHGKAVREAECKPSETAATRWHAAFPGATAVVLKVEAGTPVDDVARALAAIVAGGSAPLVALTLRGGGVTPVTLAAVPPCIRVLDVTDCTELAGPGISFAGLPALQRLDCHGAGVGDAAIASLPPSTTALSIGACTNVTPAVKFSHLPALVTFSSGTWPDGSAISDASIASLPPSLRGLTLWQCHAVTPAVVFSHLPRLTTLSVEGSAVGDAGIASLPPCMAKVVLCSTTVTRDVTLSHLPALTTLTAVDSEVGDAAVATLPATLAVLDGPLVTSAARFSHLSGLRTFRCPGITDAGVASLPPTLEVLDASSACGVTAAARFDCFPALRSLSVQASEVGDAAIASLPPVLAQLRCSYATRITPAARFSHLPALEVLEAGLTPPSRHCRRPWRRSSCPSAGA